jgi:hypothetical protein
MAKHTDPVCGMTVDEKWPQGNPSTMVRPTTFAAPAAKKSSTGIPKVTRRKAILARDEITLAI